MTSRLQITLDAKLRNQVEKRAQRAGISIAEVVRRALEKDTGERPHATNAEAVFDLGRSKSNTDIARDKKHMLGEALAGKTGR